MARASSILHDDGIVVTNSASSRRARQGGCGVSVGLVLGAAGGIGGACVTALAGSVDRMVLVDRDSGRLPGAAEAAGKGAVPVVADIVEAAGRAAIVRAVGETRDDLAWVVLASGVPLRGGLADLDEAAIAATFQANLVGPALLSARACRFALDLAGVARRHRLDIGDARARQPLRLRRVEGGTGASRHVARRRVGETRHPRHCGRARRHRHAVPRQRPRAPGCLGRRARPRRADRHAGGSRRGGSLPLPSRRPDYLVGARIAVDGGIGGDGMSAPGAGRFDGADDAGADQGGGGLSRALGAHPRRHDGARLDRSTRRRSRPRSACRSRRCARRCAGWNPTAWSSSRPTARLTVAPLSAHGGARALRRAAAARSVRCRARRDAGLPGGRRPYRRAGRAPARGHAARDGSRPTASSTRPSTARPATRRWRRFSTACGTRTDRYRLIVVQVESEERKVEREHREIAAAHPHARRRAGDAASCDRMSRRRCRLVEEHAVLR